MSIVNCCDDVWIEIFSFLEPLDIIASVSGTCKRLNELSEMCFFLLDSSQDFKQDYSNFEDYVKLKLLNDQIQIRYEENEYYIPIMRNSKYFIRHYLLKLSVKLSESIGPPWRYDRNRALSSAISEDIELFQFYLSRFGFDNSNTLLQMKDIDIDTTNMYTIKTVLVGDHGVGKSTLFTSLTREQFSSARRRMGEEISGKHVEFLNHKFIVQLWDSVGESFFYIPKIVVRYCNFAVYCFSVSNRKSLDNIKNIWVGKVEEKSDEEKIVSVLLGLRRTCTSDPSCLEERQVSIEEAFELARVTLRGALYFEVDYKNKLNLAYSLTWYTILESMFKDIAKFNSAHFSKALEEDHTQNTTSWWGCTI